MSVKEKILDEVEKMFDAYGIKAVTMDNISMDLKISKKTLYEIFKDKNDLVEQVIKIEIERNLSEVKSITDKSENVVEAMFLLMKYAKSQNNKACKEKIEDLQKYYPEIYTNVYQNTNTQKVQLLYTLIDMGINEGTFKNCIKPELTSWMLHSIFKSIETDIFKAHSASDISNSIIVPYLIGISTDKGKDLLESYMHKFKKLYE